MLKELKIIWSKKEKEVLSRTMIKIKINSIFSIITQLLIALVFVLFKEYDKIIYPISFSIIFLTIYYIAKYKYKD